MHIGVITCEILRKEIRDLIRETGVNDIFFVLPETPNPVMTVPKQIIINDFFSEFKEEGRVIKTKRMEKIAEEISERDLKESVIINALELRMHTHPDVLLAEIEASITELSTVADVVVLGYGLCGNSGGAVERVINAASVPVLIPRENSGEILNNCVEIALGRDRVQSLREEEVGTFFMTPVGAELIKEPQVILESSINITAGRMNRFAAMDTPRIIKLMKNHYNRVVKILYSEADEKDKEYAETVENFARKFNLEIKLVKGSSKIMCDTVKKWH
jgi:hypothetical protein